jgi:hypothetical protein
MHATGTVNDWYVALPSPKAIPSTLYAWSSKVQIIYDAGDPVNLAVIAPVWEVGPHNTNDDYWNSDPPDLTAANYANDASQEERVSCSGIRPCKKGKLKKIRVF